MSEDSRARPTYLWTCFKQFRAVSEARSGKPFNLEAIEQDVQELRHTRTLTYDHLQYFTNKEHWWFHEWWVFPPKESIEDDLSGKEFNFAQLSRENEGAPEEIRPEEIRVIRSLFRAFKSIELVSIILRFVWPESFGILSPPVERILDLRRGNDAIETYVNYLADLRRLREHYRLPRAADVDMALWVLHAKCFYEQLKDNAIRRRYERDPFMLKLRVENLLDSLSGVPLPLLAQSIHGIQGHLAALIGCHFFELEIRKYASRHRVRHVDSDRNMLKLSKVIENLWRSGRVIPSRKRLWDELREVRNALMHQGKVPGVSLVGAIIDEAIRLAEENQTL
jgi:hypothetical protein